MESKTEKMLAPLVLFAYKRADKIEQCMQSLLQNSEEIGRTDVYVFVDGPKGKDDQRQVEEVRKTVQNWSGQTLFKSWHVTCKEYNIGLANNVISGVTEVIRQYHKAIVVEDDLVVSPVFLRYMNEALDYYESDAKIWSIAGYTPNLKALRRYQHEIWLGYRASSWGWATWEDRWNTVDWSMADYQEFMHNEEKKKQFSRGGIDMLSMLDKQMNGYLDSWAIRWCYAQSMQDKYTVFPKVSYVTNDGYDGSGTHSGNKNLKAAEVLNLKMAKLENCEIDKRITKENYKLWEDTFWRKVNRNLGMRGIRKVLKLNKTSKVAILYICTGEYVYFWKKFYKSMKLHFLRDADVHYYVFTDADRIYGEENGDVHRVYQKQLGWPYDTLRRFDMFLSIEEQLQKYDYLFFFNSNLIIKKDVKGEEFLPTPREKLVFTIHPGQYASKVSEFTYERNPESRAYIPVGEGKVYVAGGLNGGETKAFLAMAKELQKRIAEDEEKGIVAIYHDESQINRYVYELKDYKLLHPGYLFPEDWKVPYPKMCLLLAKNKYININQIKN